MKLTAEQQDWLLKNKKTLTWKETRQKFNKKFRTDTPDRTLRRWYASVGPSKPTEYLPSHFVIGDVQAQPGLTYPHLHAAGKLIVARKPDVIINIGDFGDFPSLSSFDKGKKSAENRRFKHDLLSMYEASDILLAPLRRLQLEQSQAGEEVYTPKMIWTLGNHENRIFRYEDANPEMEGVLTPQILNHADWDVYPFLTPVVIDGVTYIHYLPNPMTGKPIGGEPSTALKQVGYSFVQGHRQMWAHARRDLTNGQVLNALICGAFYQHDEAYKGVGGNKHFRGCAYLHNVKDGNFDVEQISIERMIKEYNT